VLDVCLDGGSGVWCQLSTMRSLARIRNEAGGGGELTERSQQSAAGCEAGRIPGWDSGGSGGSGFFLTELYELEKMGEG